MTIMKARIRKTPNGRHAYTATYRGVGTYGWGDTPAEARAKLEANFRASGEKVLDRRICNADGFHCTSEAAALVERYNAA